jgi:Asp-tRNA(Asn)/Glu-tRNA(Gln) amidotransferase A subunit family amidase
MRILLFVTALFAFGLTHAQQKNDSIQLLQRTAALYDLDFSAAEADSMLDGVREYTDYYKALHQTPALNDIPYPFAFNPALMQGLNGGKQLPVKWNIPLNTMLPKNKEELAFYSVAELASLIKTKKISSVALTQFFINRLKKWGDTLQCVISFTEDIAMAAAQKADAEMAKGIYRGPLHGIPYGLKDLFAVKTTKTTWGSTPYKDQYVNEDAFVYTQLAKAGAVLCAKLSLGALAFNNKWFGGETKNPWNLKQGSSGSSAGSAAATAAGLLPFAIGTETWGSIVSPSSRCGVTGLRPTFGTVSRSGAMVLCWSLDKAGPICRSAADAAFVYDAIKGTDGKDAAALQPIFNYTGKTDFSKMRIAYSANHFSRLLKDAPEWKVLEQYRLLGANVQAVNFPDTLQNINAVMNIVLSAEAAAAFDELTRSNRDDLIERQDKNFWPNIFRTARLIPAAEYINANRFRHQLCKTVNDFMKNYDVVIVPSFSGNQLALTNLTGHPVLCMPIGFGRNNSPVSITLIGNLYQEATILAVAKAFQDKTNHHLLHPEKFKQ